VAVNLDDGVVDIDQDRPVDLGQHRGVLTQAAQQSGGHGVELRDMAEAEFPQERAQRRGRVRAVEQRAHGAMPQQRHVIDAVRAGDHPGDQRVHLAPGIGTLISGHAQMLVGQPCQAALIGQRHHWDQPGARHQIGVIEHRGPRRPHMRQSHLRDALHRD
jgi:hypothetical protein